MYLYTQTKSQIYQLSIVNDITYMYALVTLMVQPQETTQHTIRHRNHIDSKPINIIFHQTITAAATCTTTSTATTTTASHTPHLLTQYTTTTVFVRGVETHHSPHAIPKHIRTANTLLQLLLL